MTNDKTLKRALELAHEGVEIHSPNSPEYKVCAALIALAQPERHELQKHGKHTAPCARFCEANAFQIEIRRLKAQLAQPEQEHFDGCVDKSTMELAESVGLIGPTSRTHDLHQAIQRFHDLICANATVKAAQMAADAIRESTPPQRKPLTPVEGDLLPAIGSNVLIHLARQDQWVEHTVVGYYVWGVRDSNRLSRVFVRVANADGTLNARMLCDVRPIEAAHGIKE